MKAYFTREDVLALDWQKNPRGIKHKRGVYRIVDRATGEELYIGQSGDIGRRLCPSIHPVFRRSIHDVYILFENSKDERGLMEVRFIELLKPSINIRRGSMYCRLPDGVVKDYYRKIFD